MDEDERTYKIKMWSEAKLRWITHVRTVRGLEGLHALWAFCEKMKHAGHDIYVVRVDE